MNLNEMKVQQDEKLQRVIGVVQQQRNHALDACAMTEASRIGSASDLEKALARIKELEARIKELEPKPKARAARR